MNVPVFLSSDNNYAPFVATTIASICDNTKSFIEFYILDSGIFEENKEKICSLKKQFPNFSIEFIEIDSKKIFDGIDYSTAQDYISISTYNRFLIPDLKPRINKALYSDVDVIFLNDIKKMYDEDLDNYIIGAVWEKYIKQEEVQKRINRLDLSQNCKWFSSGNLIIDCQKWREKNVTRELFNLIAEYNNKLVFNDMDILNKYFDGNYKLIDEKYCWLNQYYDFYGEPKEQIVIRHFNGPTKPWQIRPIEGKVMPKNISDFWHYAKMTPYYEQLIEKCQKNVQESIRLVRINEIINKNKDKKAIQKFINNNIE